MRDYTFEHGWAELKPTHPVRTRAQELRSMANAVMLKRQRLIDRMIEREAMDYELLKEYTKAADILDSLANYIELQDQLYTAAIQNPFYAELKY